MNRLLSLFEAVDIDPDVELEYIHFAVAVSRATKNDVHCFAADDNELDVGVNAANGNLVSFGVRRDCISFVYENDQCTVTPINLFDEENEEEFVRTVGKLKSLGVTEFADVRDNMDGQQLFEHPVGQWPFDNGTAEEILGLGTWDPLINLDNDFEIIFEFEPK